MNTIVNKRNLFCDELNAVTMCEYKHELSLLRRLIKMTEKAIAEKDTRDTWSYEGICHMFATSIVSYAKMAHDNMVLGHLNAANMVLRVLIENSVFFELIYNDEKEELWKYYMVQSYRDTVIRGKDGASLKDLEFWEDMCKRYEIDKAFLEKGNRDRPYIDENYGWTYKIYKKKRFNFRGVCDLVDSSEYLGFELMSPYSHGTSIATKLSSSATMDKIMSMIVTIYIALYRLVTLYCWDVVDESFDGVTETIENIIYRYIDYQSSLE